MIPPVEPGAMGTIPKDDQAKLNPIPKEEGELTVQELRMQKEEEKVQLLYQPAESGGQRYRHGDRWIRLPIP